MKIQSTILQGHCLNELKLLPASSVQSVITSPPYFGLRQYGTNPQIWGGEESCEHLFEDLTYVRRSSDTKSGQIQKGSPASLDRDNPINYGFCRKCPAWRGELGLEPSPLLFVEHLVSVFREVWRVLRDDGTLWVNLGDSYANDSKWGGNSHSKNYTSSKGRIPRQKQQTGLKPKELIGIPWRFAFAMQEDGWYLRQDIIWSKRNPMPESVQDRCTKSHEYIFLFTKKSRYFFDIEAIKEICSEKTNLRVSKRALENKRRPRPGIDKSGNQGNGGIPAVSPKALQGDLQTTVKYNSSFDQSVILPVALRNKRSVWETSTEGIRDAHFATFPRKLIESCVLAGTSEFGACARCGAPFERITEKVTDWNDRKNNGAGAGNNGFSENYQNAVHGANNTHHQLGTLITVHKGWQPTCQCFGKFKIEKLNGRKTKIFVQEMPFEIKPCVVMDIFHGSGTTGLTALAYRRDYIGIELNPDYIRISEKRLKEVQVNLF